MFQKIGNNSKPLTIYTKMSYKRPLAWLKIRQ